MEKKWMLACLLLLAVSSVKAGAPATLDLKNLLNDGERLVLSTYDQSAPNVPLGFPPDMSSFDNPRGGLAITLLDDQQLTIYLRNQTCTSDRFGRDRFCTDPPDFWVEGALQEAGAVVDGDVVRVLYDIVIPQGTLRTRLLFTSQGESYLIIPLTADPDNPQFQRVKLFISFAPAD